MKIKKIQKWTKEVKCKSCGSVLEVEEGDVQSEGICDRDCEETGILYFVVCKKCKHKVKLCRSFDYEERGPVPPHVKRIANEREMARLRKQRGLV